MLSKGKFRNLFRQFSARLTLKCGMNKHPWVAWKFNNTGMSQGRPKGTAGIWNPPRSCFNGWYVSTRGSAWSVFCALCLGRRVVVRLLQLGPGTWPQNREAFGKSEKAMDISSCSPTHTVPEHRAVYNFGGFLSPLNPPTGPWTLHNSIAPNGLVPFHLQHQFWALITVFKPLMTCPNLLSQPSLLLSVWYQAQMMWGAPEGTGHIQAQEYVFVLYAPSTYFSLKPQFTLMISVHCLYLNEVFPSPFRWKQLLSFWHF